MNGEKDVYKNGSLKHSDWPLNGEIQINITNVQKYLLFPGAKNRLSHI